MPGKGEVGVEGEGGDGEAGVGSVGASIPYKRV